VRISVHDHDSFYVSRKSVYHHCSRVTSDT